MSNSSDSNFFDELPDWAKISGGFGLIGVTLFGTYHLIKSELKEIDRDVTYIYQKLKRSKDDAFFAIDKLVHDSKYQEKEDTPNITWLIFTYKLANRISSEPFVREEDVQELLAYAERERKNV